MKKIKRVFSAIIGICLASVSGSMVNIDAANTSNTSFSEKVNTEDKLLTYTTKTFPATRDINIRDCAYYASNEGLNYVAFRRKTDTTSVYLEVTSKSGTSKNKAKEILLKVVTTYDPTGRRTEAQAAKYVTGDFLNRNNPGYKNQSGFTSWDGGLIDNSFYHKWVKIKNYPGEYLIWNIVRDYDEKYDYCALLATTNYTRDNSEFKGNWSPDSYGSYTVLK